MVVDGAVVMIENVVRHINRLGNGAGSANNKTPAEAIRDLMNRSVKSEKALSS